MKGLSFIYSVSGSTQFTGSAKFTKKGSTVGLTENGFQFRDAIKMIVIEGKDNVTVEICETFRFISRSELKDHLKVFTPVVESNRRMSTISRQVWFFLQEIKITTGKTSEQIITEWMEAKQWLTETLIKLAMQHWEDTLATKEKMGWKVNQSFIVRENWKDVLKKLDINQEEL